MIRSQQNVCMPMNGDWIIANMIVQIIIIVLENLTHSRVAFHMCLECLLNQIHNWNFWQRTNLSQQGPKNANCNAGNVLWSLWYLYKVLKNSHFNKTLNLKFIILKIFFYLIFSLLSFVKAFLGFTKKLI